MGHICLWAISAALSASTWPDTNIIIRSAASAAAFADTTAENASAVHAAFMSACLAADAAHSVYASIATDIDTNDVDDNNIDSIYEIAADALRTDVDFIETGATAKALSQTPIWIEYKNLGKTILTSGIIMPNDLYKDWQSLISYLLGLDENWQVWTDWYEDRLRGGVPLIEAIEIGDPNKKDYGRATFPKSWYKNPAKLNAALKAKIDEYRAERDLSQGNNVPPTKFASIRTKWKNGKLIIDRSIIDPDLDAKLAIANLLSLKDEMSNFADKLGAAQRNYDDSYLELFQDFAALITNKLPDSRLIFRLMKKETALLALEETVRTQWPDPMAAQYTALCTEISDALNMFPDIRAFKRQQSDAEMENYSPEEVKNDISLRVDIMRSSHGQEIIDNEIPSGIEELLDDNVSPEEIQSLIQYDRLESVNNVMKELARTPADRTDLQALAADLDQAYTEEFAENMIEGAREAAREDAKKIGKVIARGRAANHIGKALSVKYPKQFGWMRRLHWNKS